MMTQILRSGLVNSEVEHGAERLSLGLVQLRCVHSAGSGDLVEETVYYIAHGPRVLNCAVLKILQETFFDSEEVCIGFMTGYIY